MARYIPDSNTKRWVIIAPRRTDRPQDTGTAPAEHVCPFCPGNEQLTPPEVYRLGPGEKDTTGWEVRVVPNKYTITDIHEVIIHSPSHDHDIEQLPPEQVEKILSVYRDRYRAHANEGQVLIFCNHGQTAGASLTHPHSQVVVVPNQIVFDALSKEPVMNVVEETDHVITYCPDFSQWPYEVWIVPKEAGTSFGNITADQLHDLAEQLRKTIQRIQSVKQSLEYNYYISHTDNWFLRIIPRFTNRAGFELGTGLSVNSVDPKDAAEELRARG